MLSNVDVHTGICLQLLPLSAHYIDIFTFSSSLLGEYSRLSC